MMHRETKSSWTVEEIKTVYRLKDEGKSWKEISKKIGTKTAHSIRRKFKRIDRKIFFDNPQKYVMNNGCRKWSNQEMTQLDAYLQAGSSYEFIAQKLDRSIISIERQAQETDWKAWRELQKVEDKTDDKDVNDEQKNDVLTDQLINALLTICRHELSRLKAIKEKEFLERTNLDRSKLIVPFSKIVEGAKEQLISLGLGNPEVLDLPPGTYVIVGDSHGKHTKSNMFSLLANINKTLKPSKIIHVGHILDDDNDISYDWGKFDNIVVLSKAEELRLIQGQRDKFNFKYEIIRDMICIKDLVITNQDMISDYTRTSLSTLDNHIFEGKTIVNCHRIEFSPRCSHENVSFFASPGCLCEEHIIRTIKQIDFEGGKVVKQAMHEGFIKYRRQKHTNHYWEQGILVITLDKDGNFTVVPCQIKKTSKGYATSYFDKIITSNGVFNPDKKIFVNADMHCDMHDAKVLDIQERICKDYKPDIQVNLGDTCNYSSLNHHILDRGGVITDKTILDETAQTYYVLSRVRKWAKKSYLIDGNHERFAKDFVEKYPQFANYLDLPFVCNLKDLGYDFIPLKTALKIGTAKFIHGEIRMYGQNGSKLEKASRTFGGDIFVGHVHHPEIRLGSYSIGLSGLLDQQYNEPEASNWMHGFGLCNQYMGHNFLTSISIVDNKCVINNKTYYSNEKLAASWKINKYKAKIVYDFE